MGGLYWGRPGHSVVGGGGVAAAKLASRPASLGPIPQPRRLFLTVANLVSRRYPASRGQPGLGLGGFKDSQKLLAMAGTPLPDLVAEPQHQTFFLQTRSQAGGVASTCMRLPTLVQTLIAKAGGLVLGLGSGLPLGSEGPFVHMAATIANLVMRLPVFSSISKSEELRNNIIAASCAVGVSTCFDSVFGGIMFRCA